MRRYWFELLDDSYNDLGAFIPDGSNKQLSINSMRTGNILDIIDIEIN